MISRPRMYGALRSRVRAQHTKTIEQSLLMNEGQSEENRRFIESCGLWAEGCVD